MKKSETQKSDSPYSSKDALKLVRDNLSNGYTYPTKHFKDRLKERKVTMQDIEYVLKLGRINKPPELNIETGVWKYTVRGETLDEKKIAVVLTVTKGHTTLITCVRENKK